MLRRFRGAYTGMVTRYEHTPDLIVPDVMMLDVITEMYWQISSKTMIDACAHRMTFIPGVEN